MAAYAFLFVVLKLKNSRSSWKSNNKQHNIIIKQKKYII